MEVFGFISEVERLSVNPARSLDPLYPERGQSISLKFLFTIGLLLKATTAVNNMRDLSMIESLTQDTRVPVILITGS